MITNPRDALYEAIMAAWLFSDRPQYKGPGKIIERLSAEWRAMLEQLTSEDVMDVREDQIFDDDRTARLKEEKKRREKFDSELKQS